MSRVQARYARGCHLWAFRSFASLLAIVAVVLPGRASPAYELRETSSGAPVHWPADAIEVELDPAVAAAIPDALQAVTMAAAGWSQAVAGPRISVSVASASGAPAVDGHNVVYFIPGYPPAGSALAVTLVSYDDVTGEIVDADVVLNGDYALALLPPDARATETAMSVANEPVASGVSGAVGGDDGGGHPRFDVVHVLAHEIGHILGLRDVVSTPADVMYLFTAAGDSSRRSPLADDLAGIDVLYADVPASARAGCDVSAAGSPGPGAVRLAPLALLVVLLAALRPQPRRARRRAPR